MLFFFIGLSGSGKSYWAKTLAPILSFRFLDTDEIITTEIKQPIATIFRDKGELFFREAEQKILHKILLSGNQDILIATGGGMPSYADNMDFMLQNGIVIYLEAPVETLAERLKNAKDRPLLSDKTQLADTLQRQLDRRQATYLRAHYKIDITTATTATFAAIVRSVQN